MNVSVVIPTYNRKNSLLRCVSNIHHGVEVVVVDDGPTDGTEQAIKQLNHQTLLYLSQTNRGPAAARNLGIKAASGDHIAFTDDDCVPATGWALAIAGGNELRW